LAYDPEYMDEDAEGEDDDAEGESDDEVMEGTLPSYIYYRILCAHGTLTDYTGPAFSVATHPFGSAWEYTQPDLPGTSINY
jgi:hypothetical protein